jgi:hypothetical protein
LGRVKWPLIDKPQPQTNNMDLDVKKAIKELLFENPSVIIPGLGAFTSTPEHATVDYVQGVVQPPSKKLGFNPNLVINDGLLVHHLQQSNLVTFQEAGDAVSRYVDNVKLALERREIVEIPQVGRLYKDYEQKIRFMPESTNFNASTFGLPTISFSPVTRERKVEAPASEAVPAATAAAAVAKNTQVKGTEAPPPPGAANQKAPGAFAWSQNLLPWLVLLSAVVLATSIYLIFSGGNDSTASLPPVDKERLNVKPKVEEEPVADATPPTTDAATEAPQQQEAPPAQAPAAAAGEAAPNKATSEPPAPSNSQSVYIVIHSFGVQANATKFAQTLTRDGFSPEIRKVGNLQRVGVVFPYKSQQDIADQITLLGKKYKAQPKTEQELNELQ